MTPTHYQTLGVAEDASPAAIKTAYRRLVKQLHPDLHGPATSDRLEAVVRAYRVLSVAESRHAYDRSLGRTAAAAGWRHWFGRLHRWLERAAPAAPTAPPAAPATPRPEPPRQPTDFDAAMRSASRHPAAGYVRGDDGIIRRTGPSRPIPDFTSGRLRRPAAPERTPLPKDRPWKLW